MQGLCSTAAQLIHLQLRYSVEQRPNWWHIIRHSGKNRLRRRRISAALPDSGSSHPPAEAQPDTKASDRPLYTSGRVSISANTLRATTSNGTKKESQDEKRQPGRMPPRAYTKPRPVAECDLANTIHPPGEYLQGNISRGDPFSSSMALSREE